MVLSAEEFESEKEECGFFCDGCGEASKNVAEDPSVLVPVKPQDRCMYCGRVPLDHEIKSVFGMNVCGPCSRTELRFITKTRCMREYLLTSDELRHFKCLTRPNPHRGTWNDMQLFVEHSIQEFAIEKHGGLEAIEKIKEDRKVKNKARKLEQVKKRVRDLKRRTFLARNKESHIHRFINKGSISVCECGMKIEEEEL